MKIFPNPPRYSLSLQNVPEKFRPMLIRMVKQHYIINDRVYHWTTQRNLSSIITSQYFIGNKILTKYETHFDRNALREGDIDNGDHAVICFCPAYVDTIALVRNDYIRNDLIRLTLNLQHIESRGIFNQFFKLFDLNSPEFDFVIQITPYFTACFYKGTNSRLLSSKRKLLEEARSNMQCRYTFG